MYKTYFHISIIILLEGLKKVHSELKTVRRNPSPVAEDPKLDTNGLPLSQKNLNAARFRVCGQLCSVFHSC